MTWRYGTSSAGVMVSGGQPYALTFNDLTPDPDGGPTAALSATRLSGTAPLAVLFDATASTLGDVGTYAIHDLTYAFDFDDAGSGTWAVSGLSKNTQTGGPLAAHVFETPGTYNVTVTVTDSLDREDMATVEVVVGDPDTDYPTTDTVVVSTSGNYAGAPSGAATVTSLAAAAPLAGKRILLRRGESFGSLSLPQGSVGVRIGAIGSGAKPQVSSVSIGADRALDAADFPADIVIQDLDIANGVEQTASARQILLFRCDMNDAGSSVNNMINFSAGLGYWAVDDPDRVVDTADFYNTHEMYFVENSILGSTQTDGVPYGNIYGAGARIVVMGNVIGGADQHTLRMFSLYKSFIAHNELQGRSSEGIRHSLKLHSGGYGAYADSFATAPSYATSQVVIADNLCGNAADNNDWTIAVRPQNQSDYSAEGIEDVILERNAMIVGTKTSLDIIAVGRRITIRGTTRSGAGGALMITDHTGTAYTNLDPAWRGPVWIE